MNTMQTGSVPMFARPWYVVAGILLGGLMRLAFWGLLLVLAVVVMAAFFVVSILSALRGSGRMGGGLGSGVSGLGLGSVLGPRLGLGTGMGLGCGLPLGMSPWPRLPLIGANTFFSAMMSTMFGR